MVLPAFVCFLYNECLHSTAIDIDDYFNGSITSSVQAGTTKMVVTIRTQKNAFIEENETIEATLSASHACNNVRVQQGTTQIHIIDTTGEYVVHELVVCAVHPWL